MKRQILAALLLAATAWAADPQTVPPPEGAVVLFEGGEKRDASKWTKAKISKDGHLLAGVTTKDKFQSIVLHLEFNIPAIEKGKKRNSGNSGVYIQRRYEIQILDTPKGKPRKGGCAAIYQFKAADSNEVRPRGEWQQYVIFFQAPKWETPDGGKAKKTANVRMTVFHNGVKVHDNVDVPNKTGHGQPEGPTPGPIYLQDHGCPVAYRNVWALPYEKDDDPRMKALLDQLTAADPKREAK